MSTIERTKYVLRPLRMSDAESITKHGNEKDIAKGMLYMPHPLYLSYVKLWLKRAVRDNRKVMPTQYPCDRCRWGSRRRGVAMCPTGGVG